MNDALNYAQQQADTFKNSLQYLIEQQNQQKMLDQQALTQRYSNLVNQINQQKTPIQERYSADTQGAYVNKMMAGRQLNQNLSQLGLNTQGFGINQQMLNENAYGRTLGDLATNRNAQLQGVENQLTNTLGQQQADLYSLDATYGNRLNELNQYITEQAQRKYDTEYARKTDEQRYQDEIAFRNQQREDELKQIAIDNVYRNKQLNAQYGGGGFTDNSPIVNAPLQEVAPVITGIDATNSDDVRAKDNYYFKNSTQPRYIKNKELTNKKGTTFKDVFGTLDANSKARGMSLTQNVWTDGTSYYIWSPKDKTYFDITDEYNAPRASKEKYVPKTTKTTTKTSASKKEIGIKAALKDVAKIPAYPGRK